MVRLADNAYGWLPRRVNGKLLWLSHSKFLFRLLVTLIEATGNSVCCSSS